SWLLDTDLMDSSRSLSLDQPFPRSLDRCGINPSWSPNWIFRPHEETDSKARLSSRAPTEHTTNSQHYDSHIQWGERNRTETVEHRPRIIPDEQAGIDSHRQCLLSRYSRNRERILEA